MLFPIPLQFQRHFHSIPKALAIGTLWSFSPLAIANGDADGLGDAGDINVPGEGNIRETLEKILFEVLSYVGLAAVIVIIIAGIMLVVSAGDETMKDKAKKAILYTVVGLIVILLSAAIVKIVIEAGGGGN